MAQHGVPQTWEEAKAAGYKKIEDIEAFVREHFGLTVEQFHARQHQFSLAAAPEVDCSTAQPDTICCKSCDEKTHVGIIGKCENGGCAYYSGTC
jgi:hypothetical protein